MEQESQKLFQNVNISKNKNNQSSKPNLAIITEEKDEKGDDQELMSNFIMYNAYEYHQSMFNVAQFGDTEPKTRSLSSITKIVYINDESFDLTVIDTPGAFDHIENNDEYFSTLMFECCKKIGGINIFLITFKFGSKIDKNYIALLKKYETFWGKHFWKHCIIVITFCDKDSKTNTKKVDAGLPKTTRDIYNTLGEKLGNESILSVPILAFGEENFEESVQDIFCKLSGSSGRYNSKYICNEMKSPYDKSVIELKTLAEEYNEKVTEINTIACELDNMKQKIDQYHFGNEPNPCDIASQECGSSYANS